MGCDMAHHEAFEHHEHPAKKGETNTCRFCSSHFSPAEHPSTFNICRTCEYKLLIVLLVIMISVSYIAWFGVL